MPDEDLSSLRIEKREYARRGRGTKRLYLLLAVAAALASAVLLFAIGILRPAVTAVVTEVTSVYPSQAYTVLNASGYVVAQRQAAVGAQITSRLQFLGVEEGDRVKAGQIVARLEDADELAARDRAAANVGVARANVVQAQAELVEAQRDFERNRAMASEGFVSQAVADAAQTRLDTTGAALATNRAALRAAQAALAEAEVQLGYTRIRAPFAAVVLTKDADVGDIITPLAATENSRASVLTIADMDSLLVEADVSEADIGRVAIGQPCEVQLDALPENRFASRVHMIVPTADRTKASVMVKIAFIEPDPRVLPEMSAKVAFLSRTIEPSERRPVLAVPATALVKRGVETLVYVVRNGEALARPVQPGRRLGDYVEVRAGLRAGERLVAAPGDAVKNGSRIKPAET